MKKGLGLESSSSQASIATFHKAVLALGRALSYCANEATCVLRSGTAFLIALRRRNAEWSDEYSDMYRGYRGLTELCYLCPVMGTKYIINVVATRSGSHLLSNSSSAIGAGPGAFNALAV